jgi:hypothetical protein
MTGGDDFEATGGKNEWMGKLKYLEKNCFSRCVHHKSHMNSPGIEPGTPRWEFGN